MARRRPKLHSLEDHLTPNLYIFFLPIISYHYTFSFKSKTSHNATLCFVLWCYLDFWVGGAGGSLLCTHLGASDAQISPGTPFYACH